MQAKVTVVAAEEKEVAAEEGAAVAEAVAAAAAGAEMTMMMTMTMMTMMTMVHPLVEQARPVEPDVGFSTIKKWSSNWPKSCKINARWLRDDESPASQPPIPSQPRIRMDAVPP